MARKSGKAVEAYPDPVVHAPSGPSTPGGPTRAAATITRDFEIYGASSQADLDFLRTLGFTQVILDSPALARPAESAGFAVVLANWWDNSTQWGQVLPIFRFAEGLTRLVSVNMMDEPMLNGLADHAPAVYLALREAIREHGFDQRLSLTMYGPQLSWPAPWLRVFLDYLGAIDVLRIDPYPIAAGKPLRLVVDWINLARQLMASAGRDLPLTVILQAWDSGDGLPSIDQIRAMAYMALLSGADTLSFFSYDPATWYQTPGFVEGFTALMGELVELAREFAGAEIHPILGAEDLFEAEIDLDGRRTCITVNTLGRPNGTLGPLQVVREGGHCPRPLQASGPQEGLLPPNRKRAPAEIPGAGEIV